MIPSIRGPKRRALPLQNPEQTPFPGQAPGSGLPPSPTLRTPPSGTPAGSRTAGEPRAGAGPTSSVPRLRARPGEGAVQATSHAGETIALAATAPASSSCRLFLEGSRASDPTGQGTPVSPGPVQDDGNRAAWSKARHPPAPSGPPGMRPGWGRSWFPWSGG